MLHSFWCWVNRKSLEAIVRSARRELARHMANKPDSTDHGGVAWSSWYERRDRLNAYLRQETFRMTMIGGSV